MKTILVVDDSDFIRNIERKALEKGRYKVIEASTAESALKLLIQHRSIDLIISDINMPGMNGLEMAEKVKQDSNLRNIPFIMLTTESDQGYLKRAMRMGITQWLVKPFQPEDLLNRVRDVIGNAI